MRRRVLLPLVILGLLTVIAVLVPIADTLAGGRTQQLTLQRAGALDQILQHARVALAQGDPDPLAVYLERFETTYGESALVVDAEGDVVASSGTLAEDAAALARAADAARAIPGRVLPTAFPWAPDRALMAEPLSTAAGAGYGAVVLEVDMTTAKGDVARGWLIVAMVGVLLLTVLVAAAQWATRWVLRPVVALDAAAHAVAEGRDPGPLDRTGPPELRRLSDTFAEMARDVEDSLEQQRRFVADASHQLRNPLAATRLRIDGLALDAGDLDRAQLDEVQADLDRLDHTIDRMLTLAGADHRADAAGSSHPREECETSAALLSEPHRAALEAAGMALARPATTTQRVPAAATDLHEIVGLLVDNARKYAGTGATVTVDLETRRSGVALVVSDDGPGLSDDDLASIGTRFWRAPAHQSLPGTGLGLAIVVQLARANGATLAFDRAPGGGLRVTVQWDAR